MARSSARNWSLWLQLLLVPAGLLAIPPKNYQGTYWFCGQEKFNCDEASDMYNSYNCIPMSWVCDGNPDCDNGTDEEDCSRKDPPSTATPLDQPGWLKHCEALLGYPPNVTSSTRQRALHRSAKAGNARCVDVFLKAGADIEAKHAWGASALHMAALHGHPDAVRTLLKWGASVAAKDRVFRRPLHSAVWGACAECVDALLGAGAEVEARDLLGRTALWTAVWRQNVDTMSRLLAAGADPNGIDNRGCSPLVAAASSKCVRCVKALLDQGAYPDNNSSCDSALNYAIRSGSHEIVDLLLDGDAKVQENGKRQDPLEVAIREECLECVKLLIRAGADPYKGTLSGREIIKNLAKSEEILELLSP